MDFYSLEKEFDTGEWSVSGQTESMFLVRKNILVWTKDKPFRMKRGYILPYTIMRCFLLVMTDKTENGVGHSKIWEHKKQPEERKVYIFMPLSYHSDVFSSNNIAIP